MNHSLAIVMAALLLGACQSDEASNPEAKTPLEPEIAQAAPEEVDIAEAIDRTLTHPDRPPEDRDRDGYRHPDEILAFAGIKPGMCVLDFFTAGGYYAEILSRLVGDEGEVWAQNPPQFYERFGSATLDFRLADRRLPNVERQDRPMDDLALPAERFDAVVAAMVFHDLFWITDDVPHVLDQLFAALRPGGFLLITDHAAPEGSKAALASEPDNKHRVDPVYVTELMEAAGFELVDTSNVLANPDDERRLAFFEMHGEPTDRFVHLYRKPG